MRRPHIGLTIVAWLPMSAASVVSELYRQGLSALGPVFFVITLYALLLLPPITGLLLLLRDGSPARQRTHLAVLLFAVLAGGLLPFVMTRMDRIVTNPRFWGIWLFVIVSAAALLFELLSRWRRPPRASQSVTATRLPA
jgi:hypothetical protein